MIDKRLLRHVVSSIISITEFPLEGGFRQILCPFHIDTTPSARLFTNDEDGIDKIYCFSCQRQFTSYDYIEKVLKEDPYQYLLKRFSPEEINVMLERSKSRVVERGESKLKDVIDELGKKFIEDGQLFDFLLEVYLYHAKED